MTLPFVISLPHSAGAVPPDLRSNLALTQAQITRSIDEGTMEIFGSLPTAACIPARWSRFVVDLNRNPQDTDEKGVVASLDYHDRPIFLPGREPGPEEIQDRVERFHIPFHRSLAAALEKPGIKGLFDCHSLDGQGPDGAPDPGRERADLVLGNRGNLEGEFVPGRGELTCPPDTLRIIRRAFESAGLSVDCNRPYSGGYIIQRHAPDLLGQGKWAVQIEIKKDLYMDSGRSEIIPAKLDGIQQKILGAFESLAEIM